jgi:hypothetical protein
LFFMFLTWNFLFLCVMSFGLFLISSIVSTIKVLPTQRLTNTSIFF